MTIDMHQALLDPTSVFTEPQDVVASQSLSNDQKIEILKRWEYDALELEVAEDEAGMIVRRPEMFDRVVEALHSLGVQRDTEHSPPTR